MLTKTEQLFIRACKSKDANVRLRSVYRKFYLSRDISDSQIDIAITSILAFLIDKYSKGVAASDVLSVRDEWFNHGSTIDKRILTLFIHKIRFDKCDKLRSIGYVTPVRYRN